MFKRELQPSTGSERYITPNAGLPFAGQYIHQHSNTNQGVDSI
jgi:hypothetical protein